MLDFDKLMIAKQKFIPKSGFNLVEIDTMEDPAEAITLINNFKIKLEAEREMTRLKKKGDGLLNYYIYEPQDN
jgi:hypothetical protein